MKPHRILIAIACVASPLWSAQPAAPRETPKPAATESKATGTKSEQLAAAHKELGALRLRHDDQHPAVLKARAKVARLQKEVREEQKVNPKADRGEQLAAAKQDLDKLLEKYTDQHPVVVAQRKRIAELEQQKN